jgi:hypothetical protein
VEEPVAESTEAAIEEATAEPETTEAPEPQATEEPEPQATAEPDTTSDPEGGFPVWLVAAGGLLGAGAAGYWLYRRQQG